MRHLFKVISCTQLVCVKTSHVCVCKYLILIFSSYNFYYKENHCIKKKISSVLYKIVSRSNIKK